jgi:hypothetical protein
LASRRKARTQIKNRELRGIFGPKRQEVRGGWRELRILELRNLYSSPNITRIIKLRKMRYAGHVAREGDTREMFGRKTSREGTTWET